MPKGAAPYSFFDLMFSVLSTYKNEIVQKKDESCDLSSLVACRKILSNSFIRDLTYIGDFMSVFGKNLQGCFKV